MRLYRSLGLFFALFALLYASLGSITWEMGRFEIFPFFSWSLFSDVPPEVTDYGVKIVRVGDETLAAPRYFEYASEWFADAQSINAWANIQALGRASAGDANEDLAQRKAQFEEFHLKNRARVVYSVYRRRYQPLERWRSGEFLHEELIAEYQSE